MSSKILGAKIYCKPSTKVAYLPIPKVASTSVRNTFLESEEARKQLAKTKKQLDENVNKNISSFEGLYFNGCLFRDTKKLKEAYSKYFSDINLVDMKGFRYDANRGWVASGYDKGEGFNIKPASTEEINSYFIFTFVRNPFARLVSCFQNKYNYIETEKTFFTKYNMENLPERATSFSDFVRQVIKTPNAISNPHVKTQFSWMQSKIDLGVQVDFIGKFETLTTEFELIRQKYGLLPLEIKNSSTDKAQHKKWQDYYTPELARFVYERYFDDFKQFGYQVEYPKLLAHLNAPLPWRFRKRKLLGKLGVKPYQKFG